MADTVTVRHVQVKGAEMMQVRSGSSFSLREEQRGQERRNFRGFILSLAHIPKAMLMLSQASEPTSVCVSLVYSSGAQALLSVKHSVDEDR